DVGPVLRPDVAKKVRGNGTVGGNGVAVFFAQTAADVGMQGEIERTNLLPQAIELLAEIVGRHVVTRAPHRAGVFESELARALVRELDEAGEIGAHHGRNLVPTVPGVEQLFGIGAVGHDAGDVFDVETFLLAARIFGRTVFAFAVGGLE